MFFFHTKGDNTLSKGESSLLGRVIFLEGKSSNCFLYDFNVFLFSV
jgi:hypothetical protein